MRYAIIVERGPENCSAYAPDARGCVATGETVEETVERMREAIAFHFEGIRLAGLPIPEPATACAMVDIL